MSTRLRDKKLKVKKASLSSTSNLKLGGMFSSVSCRSKKNSEKMRVTQKIFFFYVLSPLSNRAEDLKMEEGLTSSVVMTQVRRWLGSNDDYFISDSSTRAPSNLEEHRHKGDSLEFFAFLLWYMFLVVCCVLPTFCAYRRRRQMARLAERQSQLILQNAVFFSNLRLSASAEEARKRSLRTERTKSITQALKETSFVSERTVSMFLISSKKQ